MSDVANATTKHASRRVVSPGEALSRHLEPLRALLNQPGTTDITVNRPGQAWVKNARGWKAVDVPALTHELLRNIARLIATYNQQILNEKSPVLPGSLPGGERVQVIIAPAVGVGQLSITIRKPSTTIKTQEEYERDGLTADVCDISERLTGIDRRLIEHRKARRYWDFFKLAIKYKRNIVISGATGSGKTTLSKTLASFIPAHERLITIEDVRELDLPNHANQVNLLYSVSGWATSRIDAKTLLQACLRMKPSRILLAEIRSKVAYDYIVNVSSGHPGSITTVHAGSCHEAFEMLALRMLESPEGRELSRDDIMGLLRSKIDIIIQITVIDQPQADGTILKARRVTEIYHEPILAPAWS